MRIGLFHPMLVVLALSASAMAQDLTLDPAKPFNPTLQQAAPKPETYGTTSEVSIAITDFEFTPFISTSTINWNAGRYVTVANGGIIAGVHLPAGALITRMELQACDTNASAQGSLDLDAKPNSGGFGSSVGSINTGIGAAPGCTLFPLTLLTPHTVNNSANSYYLFWSNTTATDGSVRIQAARVFYKLQISPDPATATFADVPLGHPLHRFVEALVAAGITGGCGGGNYCPDAPITRGQMAVFLSAALGLHWAP